MSEGQDQGHNQISGSEDGENINGTTGNDFIQGNGGDDTIRGGSGADIIDGGAGSDRIVFTDTESVDTIYFTQSGNQSDIIDVSALVPADVTAATLKNYVKINANGIYVDTEGQGQFSSSSQVARFASGNPPLSVMSAIQVAATNSVIDFDWTETANIPLVDAHDYVADSVGHENTISGTAQADNLQGTAAADSITGRAGDDTLNGGAGADYLDGGAGNDRYVLANPDAVDTVKVRVTSGQQDSIDVSHLLPPDTEITAENVENYVQITDEAVFVDETGQGDFSDSNKVAEFTEDSVFDSHTITIHVAENTALVLDVVPSVGVQLAEGESFASEQLLSQTLDTLAAGAGLGDGAGILRSSRGQKFNLKLDEHNLTEAFGGAGDEQLDATSIAARNTAQSASEADYAVKLYGRDGNDTLVGNDDGGVLDGGAGSDRIESGKGRNLLIGGEGEDEFALTLESSESAIKSDKLYDFSSREGNRDLLDLKDVLPAEATAQNIHSYVKVTGKGIFVDVSGQGQFNEDSQLARFGERVDIDDLINIRLNDGTNIQLDRSGAISTIQGEADSDLVQAGEGSDTLYGNAGDDTLDGDGLGKTKSADHLFGGEGNDKIIADKLDFTDGTVDGGVGFDRVYINEDEGQSVTVDLHASGVERADGGDSNDVLDGSGYTDSSGGYNKETGAYETAEAQRLDLYGRGGKDTLIGGVGRDYLDGGIGDDSLSGGQGRDFMTGGSGNDTFILADDDELDVIWDFTSSGDQYDVIDISAFTSDDFDYNSLPDYFSIDDDYIYFDTTGTGTFTENEAIAKLGGGTTIDNDYIKVEVDGTRIGYNPTSKSVVYVNSNDPDAAATGSTVAEDSGENTVVGQVSYTDQDGVEPITYSIVSGNEQDYFAIDSSTGQVTLTAAGEAGIDYETATSHTLQVMATDRDFSSTPVNLVVNLADINDEAPSVSLSSNVVNENSPEGTVLGQVTGADPDTTGETLSYAIYSGNDDGYFAIDSSTGQVTLTAAGSANFDYETAASHTVYVTASDGTNTSTPLPLTFQLNDINEGPEVSGAVSIDATEDLSFTLTKADLLENASDVDGDSLSVSNVAVASGQVNVTDNGDDTWTVAPQSNWSGNSQITFTVSDGSLTTNAQADISVAAAADVPVLTIGGSTQISHTNFNSGLGVGWTSVNSIEIDSNGGSLGSSPSGSKVAELDASSGGSPDAYFYNIDTRQGNDHEVSLMVRQRDGFDGTDEIEVVWNGEVIQTIDPGASWQEVKVRLPDIGLNNTQLIIREVAGQNNGAGPLLDQITVNRMGVSDSESSEYDKIILNREDTVFTLDLSASLSDNDGSESLEVTLAGIPAGFGISDGSNSMTTTGADVDVSNWNLSALTFTPIANHDVDFNMTVTASTTDGVDTASTSQIIRVDMQPVADAATVTGDDTGAIYEDSAALLTKSGSLAVNDGDSDEQSFVAETVTGTYGSVTIDSDGEWVYSADNNQNAIQSLSQSQTLNLDGSTDDYVRIESDLVPSDDFTISLWVKPDLVDSNPHGFLGSEPSSESSRSPSLYVDENGKLVWSSNGTDDVSYSGEVNGVFNRGEWSHITWVKDGTEYRFYKDGELIHTDSAPADVKLTGSTNLGRVDNAFGGELDDIQTYDRALSASEISSAMNGETQSGLFAHYDFAGYSLSQALEDRAGNHPDGVVNGNMNDADLGKRVETLTDTLTVRTADGTTHDINITINGRNDGPTVTVSSPTVSVSTNEDVNLVLTKADLLANVEDADDADSLSISDIVVELGDATITDNHDGTWTLTPDANWAGTGKFSYTVSDGDKLLRVKGDFAVDSVADTPVVTFASGDNPTFTINEDEVVPLNMTAEFGDLDGSETYSLVISDIPAGVTISDGSNSVTVSDGSLDVTGWQYSSITVTPPVNSGTDFDLTLTATATESDGEQSTVTRTVSVDITGQNDAPVVTIEARGAETPVQLNTSTTGDQEGVELAIRPNGGYVAVWTDKSQGGEGQIIGRLYDKDGAAESAEFRVDTGSVKTGSANVAVHDDGSFVVVWSDTNTGGRGQIEVQRFDASGSPVSSNTTVMSGNLHHPDVITLSNGDYVVSGYDSWHGSRTEMQVFNSSGSAKSGVITTGSIGRHAGDVDSMLNSLSDGNWANTVRNNSTGEVKVSVYDNTGTAVGSDSFTASEPGLAVTTLSDGGMAVVYSDSGTIKLRSFDNNGQLSGSEVDLGQTSAGEVAVTELTDGTLFISWNETGGLYGQRFLADGTEAGGKTTLTTEAGASDVSMVELEDGSLQLAWHSEGVDGNGHAVVASNLIVPVDDLANGTVVATANAVDGDQDTLTYSLSNDAGGRYTIDSSTGEITVADSSLIDFAVSPSHTITVDVSDGTVTTTTDYTIYNNNNNKAPETADSTASAREDISYVFTEDDFPIVDPNSNDYISEIRIESVPDTGSMTLNGVAVEVGDVISVSNIQAGNLQFLANNNENDAGYTSFTFNVADRLGLYSSTPKTLTINVSPENDTPDSIALDSLNITENSAGGVVGTLTTTDVDVGDSHTYTVSDNRFEVSGNQLKLKAGISLDHEAESSVNVTVTSTDSAGASVDQQFTLNVTDANDAPVVSGPVTKTGNEDNSFTLTEAELLANTTDADNDALSVSNVAVSSGQVSVTDNGDGTWTVAPDSNWSGSGQLTFDISDGTTTVSARANLSISAVADSPVLTVGGLAVDSVDPAYDKVMSSQEDTTIALDLNAALQDTDGSETLAVTLTGIPAGFGLSDGNNSLTTDGGSTDVSGWNLSGLTLTPVADYETDFTLTVTAASSESVGGNTATTTQTIRVDMQGVQDAAVISGDDTGAVTEDAASTLTTSGTLSATDVDAADTGFTAETVNGSYGSVAIDADGNWSYSADNSQAAIQSLAAGETLTDSINVRSADGTQHTLEITVTGTNDAPVASGVDLGSVVEDGSFSITQAMLLANASDIDGDSLTVTSLSIDNNAQGSVTDNGNGTWTFTPAANLSAEDVEFSFVVSDGSSGDEVAATATIDVTGVADAPAVSFANVTDNDNPQYNTDEDSAVGINLSAALTDLDGSETLGVALSGIPAGATISDGTHSELVSSGSLDISGWNYASLSVLPPANSHDDFELSLAVTATEAGGDTSTVNKIISVQVATVDDAPVAGNVDLGSTAEDTSVVITQAQLLANASDIDGDSLSVTSISIGNDAHGALTDNGNGTWTYTPAADYNGADVTFSFTVSDGSSGDEVTATATIDIASVNDAPVAAADVANETGSIGVLSSNSDQGITVTASGSVDSGYEPYKAFDGTDADPVNNQNSWAVEGHSGWLQVEIPAAQRIGKYSIKAIGLGSRQPKNWELLASSDGVNFTVIDSRSGVNNWAPRETKEFMVEDAGTYTHFKINITDNNGNAYTGFDGFQLFEWTSTTAHVEEGETLSFDVLANDTDIDQGDTLSLDSVEVVDSEGNPLTGKGQVTIVDGKLQFDAAGDFGALKPGDAETVRVRYTISDAEGAQSTSHAEITVFGAEHAPVANDVDLGSTNEDVAIVITRAQLLAGASDIDGDALSVSGVALADAAHGTLINNGDDTWTYTPVNNFNGENVVINFTVTDGTEGHSASAVATIDVVAVNDAPATPEAIINQLDVVWGGSAITDKNAASYNLPTGFELGDTVWLTKTDGGYGKGVKIQISDNGDGMLNIKVVEAKYTDLGTWNSLTAEQQETYFENAGNLQFVATSDSSSGYGISQVSINGGKPAPGFVDTSSGINIEPFAVVENSVNGTVVGRVSATDLDSSELSFSLTDDAGGRFSIDSITGEITVADSSLLNYEAVSSHVVTVQVSDGSAVSARNYTVLLKDANDAPELSVAPENQVAEEESVFSYTLPSNTFSDEDNDSLTYSATLASGDPLPDWLSFDPVNRHFSGTPDDPDLGVLQVRVTATDGTSSTFVDFDVTVNGINDQPISADGNLLMVQGNTYTFAPADFVFTDADVNNSLQAITITTLPSSGTLTLNGTSVAANQSINLSDIGNLEYTAPETNTDQVADFSFTVSDGELSSEPHVFNLEIKGASSDNALTGSNDAGDIIQGSEHAETLRGEGGNDTLLGEEGADLIFGGAGDDVIQGDSNESIPVNLDADFITAASTVSLPPATGLKAEVFDTDIIFVTLDQAVNLTNSSNPRATFTASEFNYHRGGNNQLADFLGSDGDNLTGHGHMSDQTFALKMTGYIRLSAGTHDFNVASDDGFRLKINNEIVTEFTAVRGVATSSGNFTAPQDGLYKVELVYWQSLDGADLDITSSTAEPFQFYDMLPAGVELVSGQDYYDLPTSDVTVDVADGVSLSKGTDNGDGTWTLKGSELSGLTMTGSGNNWDDSLTFTAKKQTKRSIDIGDSSFESHSLGDGGHIHNPGSSAWSFSSSNTNGIHNYNHFNMIEQSSEGTQVGFINQDGGIISQTLSENFDRDTVYELKVDIGNRNDTPGFADYEVRIKAGDVILASDGSVTPAEGYFDTLTLTLDGASIAANSAAVGQPITIELVKNSGPQIAFDNVRLTAVTTEQIGQETVNTDQSDQITGGAGDDILTGGNDTDTFIWSSNDLGTAEAPAEDTITDFQAGQGGDILDLSDVLVDDNEPLEDYLSLNFENGNTTIEVKPDASGGVTQKIKLEGVDLSGYGGGTNDAEILNNLLSDGNLQIDP